MTYVLLKFSQNRPKKILLDMQTTKSTLYVLKPRGHKKLFSLIFNSREWEQESVNRTFLTI
jgi:hypothetical protein